MKFRSLPILLFGLLSITLIDCTQSDSNSFITSPGEVEKYLHVPSPDWQDQILYFIVTDRFMDGDTTNNDQGVGEYKKGDGGFWNGGDIQGIMDRMDYIKELGATGIWITPPVANQWRNPQKTGTGNHGYWATNFMEVDKHLGTLEDYQQLSATLHKNGMYLIQDIVCNHLGDFYTYTGPYNPADVGENFTLHEGHAPTQYPFTHNNALDSQDRKMAIYHFAPNFDDHSDTVKKRIYQFADLDDLNTSNPLVRSTLRRSYNYWIEQVGVDGFRFDTPHFVEHAFWNDFIHSKDSKVPGVQNFAQSMGKEAFFTFGEVLIPTHVMQDEEVQESARYLGTSRQPEMTSILNFPLFFGIQRVFQEMRPTSLMTYRLESLKRHFPRPELLVNFIDNHDGARFLSRADKAAFRQALLFIMTLPGVPVIYYGTEQELLGTRQTMFKGGAGSPHTSHFDTGSEAFGFVQDLIRLRKAHRVFRRGNWEILRDAPGGPGIFAYKLSHGEEMAIVLLNTSEREMLGSKMPTGLAAGTLLKTQFSLDDSWDSLLVDEEASISLILPPKSGRVYISTQVQNSWVSMEESLALSPLPKEPLSANRVEITGESEGLDSIWVGVDGDKDLAQKAQVQADGSWKVVLPLTHLVNGPHVMTAFSFEEGEANKLIVDTASFVLELPVTRGRLFHDPHGDDHGLNGHIQYPTSPSFTHQQDIHSVRVDQVGTNLNIELKMGAITQEWLPPNEFDHALINIYIDLPGEGGQSLLPFQHASFPGGGKWDVYASVAGFGNAIYSYEGSSTNNPGTATGPSPSVRADLENRTLYLSISAEALGYPQTLSGTKIYINTWGGGPTNLRGLNPEASKWQYGGGRDQDAKIMDDIAPIVLE